MELSEIFEEFLQKNLCKIKTFHPFYQDALNYMLEAPGKRFRPLLLLSIVKAVNPLLIPSSLQPAMAIELLHTYSLIHDDLPVMDNATIRRGRATLHIKYDELSAVLIGDALNTHAFYLLATSPLSSDVKVRLCEILAYNGGIDGMVHGQILDCYFEKKPLDLEQLKQLHINKTAKLIAASLQMGAVIAGLERSMQERLYDFGIDLGLLFQIQDDIIDATLSSEEAGKTTSNDENKNSFVNLLGLPKAIEQANSLAKELEVRLKAFPANIATALHILLQDYFYRHKGKTDG